MPIKILHKTKPVFTFLNGIAILILKQKKYRGEAKDFQANVDIKVKEDCRMPDFTSVEQLTRASELFRT